MVRWTEVERQTFGLPGSHTLRAETEQGDDLASRFSSHTVSSCAFCGPFSLFLCFLLVMLLFKVAPNCRAEVVFSVLGTPRPIALWRKHTCEVSFVQTGVTVLLAASSVLMS